MHQLLCLLALFCLTLFISSATEYRTLEGQKGANTSEILEFKENGKSYIEKVFNNHASFEDELNKISHLEPEIEHYLGNIAPGRLLPKIARYHGHHDNRIQYEKAQGESFYDFLVRAAITEIQMPDTKATLLNSLKKAGLALGNFHAVFKDPRAGDKFLTAIHGDLHPSNVFFDFYDGAVTFIDYSSMSFKEKRDAQIDIDKFFQFATIYFAAAIGAKLIKESDYQRAWERSWARFNEYKSALAEGYNQALLEHQTGFKLVQHDNRYVIERH